MIYPWWSYHLSWWQSEVLLHETPVVGIHSGGRWIHPANLSQKMSLQLSPHCHNQMFLTKGVKLALWENLQTLAKTYPAVNSKTMCRTENRWIFCVISTQVTLLESVRLCGSKMSYQPTNSKSWSQLLYKLSMLCLARVTSSQFCSTAKTRSTCRDIRRKNSCNAPVNEIIFHIGKHQSFFIWRNHEKHHKWDITTAK